ncbi:MAG: bifunctional pyr operon transcriptional regulator/uracil phosphoribosyltransferase PyrR [Gammaproteobacteria bacterium]|nr:bifunctional pyr operon transcriptional regulator/uracil phosphoribosyltransferase PyrR [Gammaproteobacteria bacterium]
MTSVVDLDAAFDNLQDELTEVLESESRDQPLFVGIQTGGLWVAQRLQRALDLDGTIGTIDISFYRDDFSRIGLDPSVGHTSLPFDIVDRHVVLVDDVLHTGRTVRAALNELFDYGRPASVALAILIERGGRELPIHADAVGVMLDLEPSQHVQLLGPEPLSVEIMTVQRRGDDT